MRVPCTVFGLWIFHLLFLCNVQLERVGAANGVRHIEEVQDHVQVEEWQSCQTFLAPSPTTSMGWGVFAGRSFRKGEIVELAPGTIPMDQDSLAISETALDDYVYGYFRLKEETQNVNQRQNPRGFPPNIQPMYAVMLGMGMVFNHHPCSPNLEYTTFGREPAAEIPHAANAIGFMATRDIARGEELFSSYGKDDGGEDWFRRRKIPMTRPLETESDTSSLLSESDFNQLASSYCSKAVAGMGRSTWKDRILTILPPPQYVPFWMDPKWLPPWNAEIGQVRAKTNKIMPGERIEVSTALLLSKQALRGTPLAPLALEWDDFVGEDQERLRAGRKEGRWILQRNDWTSPSEWNRVDGFTRFEDVAVLPIGGTLGMMERIVTDNSSSTRANCEVRLFQLPSNHSLDTTVVVTLEVVATTTISVGDVLKVALPPSSRPATSRTRETQLLQTELRRMGREPTGGPFRLAGVRDVTTPGKKEGSTAGSEL